MDSIDDALDSKEPLQDGVTVTAGFKDETFRLRTYQAEMVEKSLEGNIIVAMDTGSGKTHIALARTAAELETCHPNKLVWFLAPTVTLCEQQFAVFQTALPAYGSILLSGKDDVDHWTDQATWDDVLKNARIVLSTHAILLDALSHGFVKMDKLALIIFDEAHHCTLKHPANQIMTNFYKPLVTNSNDVWRPRILGLSASPVMRAKANRSGLEQIEENLNAITKTPKIHRSELIRFVHKPELLRVPYSGMDPVHPPLLAALIYTSAHYDIESDPWVLDLIKKQRQGFDNMRTLQKVMVNRKTYCAEQLKQFATKAEAMYEELGPSATSWYIHHSISKFGEITRGSDAELLDWTSREKDHLLKLLTNLPLSKDNCPPMSWDQLSPKVQCLIDVLVTEASDEVTGLVFVEQRVWVAALFEILSLHPQTRDLFAIGTFVGTSQSSKRRKNIADLVEVQNHEETLADFRSGKKNIILTTSVLEEGIDVSSCHLVICFERPKNLKSFIQRRGRARKQKSKYLIFQAEDSTARAPATWEALEEEMKAAYLNDLRQVQQAEEKELSHEDGEMFYEVGSTGALLSLDNALPHLNHFCSLLGSGPYIDPRPQFSFIASDTLDGNMNPLLIAEVVLPISVDPTLRKARGKGSWVTERMAKKDAAFQAYKALHIAGLINDNLLPARNDEEDAMQEFQIPDHTPALVSVSPTLDPWILLASHQQPNSYTYHRILLKLHTVGEDPFYLILLTPFSLPELPEIILHWNEKVQYSVKGSWLPGATFTKEELLTLRDITWKILHSIHGGRMQDQKRDFLFLLAPSDARNLIWNHTELQNFNAGIDGRQSAIDVFQHRVQRRTLSNCGLVSVKGDGKKYMLKGVIEVRDDSGDQVCQLQVTRAPKRRDFLHPVPVSVQSNRNDAYTRIEVLNAADCVVNNLPVSYSIFALFVPAIISRCQDFMVAETLRTTLLQPLSFESSDLPLLVRALTSSTADEQNNYQRLEFFGDCVLKFIATTHLMGSYLTWPESFLTGKKGRIVSNGFLARATMKAGLDEFVITKKFTGAKWVPKYAGDVVAPQTPDEKVLRSSKLIADVIESLIGASYVKGGFATAQMCVQTLLTMEDWMPIHEANSGLFNAAPDEIFITPLTPLETLIGHTFIRKQILLEAVTHPSFTGPNANCSYERLEFLGDAVLDYMISKRLFEHSPPLSHQNMHAMRSAMANANFLAFRMFETTLEEMAPSTPMTKPKVVHRALWQYMRHGSPQLLGPRDAALAQHNEAREQITEAMRSDGRFPWHLFSLTDAPKFLSDMVESVIGGIYVDSQGSIEACEVFVRRLGILDALDRILRDGVDCLHPKERLGHLAVEKSVQYVNLGPKKEAGKKVYVCQVKVGDVDIGGPVEGIKRLNAETMAAWKAIAIMEEEKDEDEEWHDVDEYGGVVLDTGE
ncbi:hypothetical protein K504DRAFT_372348 [Pleomassaria siparia CBS 279.74]|uniref:P-loop containing nucleoside triphosphate hydrolase protein n=1 Tax=Pleomassaria siparia CBS 279.74 TaxID=1314801 RepID=A0A6G1KHN6_9PLEO|nr:hypothetical protein K504DRAFT_372348 [Pleomassaria siparia CBS 279.74]